MPDETLKVFISWSGEAEKQIAIALRELLPVIFDKVSPWVSDRDIGAGGRGMQEIAKELDETAFGIIIVTRDNQTAPWINFEAGSLSKRFGSDEARVIPLLADMEAVAELEGPLTQFQAKLLNRAGVEDVLSALGGALGVSDDVIKRRLNTEWDDFMKKVSVARSQQRHPSRQPKRSVDSMVEETLELVRTLSQQFDPHAPNKSGLTLSIAERKRRALLEAIEFDPFFRAQGVTAWKAEFEGNRLVISITDPFIDSKTRNAMYGNITKHLHDRGISEAFNLVINGEHEPPF